MTELSEFSKKNKSKMVYPDSRSALKPVPHCLWIPVPIPSAKSDVENEETYESCFSSTESSTDKMYVAYVDEKKPHLLSQLELNDLVRDYPCPKKKQSY